MCTIAVAHRVFADHPVVIAANRDEDTGRSFTAPEPEVRDTGWLLAPHDDRAGGVWQGVNDAGLAVAIANLPTSDGEPSRSRGLLALEALRCDSARAARAAVGASMTAEDYDGFNLVLADGSEAVVVVNDVDGASVHYRELDPGVHVVTNAPGPGGDAKAEAVADALPEGPAGLDDWLDGARDVLADHEIPVCIHGEGYGTTSSSLLAVNRTPEESRYLFADGRPCETPYEAIEVPSAEDTPPGD